MYACWELEQCSDPFLHSQSRNSKRFQKVTNVFLELGLLLQGWDMPTLLVNHELATINAVRQIDVQFQGRDPVVPPSIYEDWDFNLREPVPDVKS